MTSWSAAEAGARATAAGMEGALRLMAGPPAGASETLRSHLQRLGPLPEPGSRLIEEAERARLRGRGGAGFPTYRKLAAVRDAGRRLGPPVVIGNGLEREPLGGKDQELLTRRPQLVLDGLQLAARAVGAQELFLAVTPDSSQVMEAVRTAAGERARSGLREPPVEVVTGATGFVAGEETALIAWMAGGPAKPRAKPPLTVERGLVGRPTLVQNVETLAQLAILARFGAGWFTSVGTEEEPGTMLVTIGGAVSGPGVYEVCLGTPLGPLLSAAGWAPASKAVLVGGYFGSWVPSERLAGASLSSADLNRLGAFTGSGVLWVLPRGRCGLRTGAQITSWLAGQRSLQCGPCTFGLAAIAEAMELLARPGPVAEKVEDDLRRWCSEMPGRGACKHPDGTAGLARSTLDVFEDELVLHRRGRCSSRNAEEPDLRAVSR